VRPGERYVLVGLASHRSDWFGEVARWAQSGAAALEFHKTSSVEEALARLGTGRRCSAVLVSGTVTGWDRDAAAEAEARGCAVVAVDDRPGASAGNHPGTAALLPAGFELGQLLAVLDEVAQPVPLRDEAIDLTVSPASTESRPWSGQLVAVTGAPGTGRSTLAMALAAALASDPRDRGLVVLADLALRAHQALLHDAGDVVPGLSELVDAHRRQRMSPGDVRAMAFRARKGGHDVLLGLRRPRDWVALRPEALAAALDSLSGAYRYVVTDSDAEVEGQTETGMVEIEDRNQLARVGLGRSHLVVAVGRSGLSGLRDLALVVNELLTFGVPADRVLAVVNRAPRGPRRRAELAGAFHALLEDLRPGVRLAANLLFVTERRGLDDLVAGGAGPPAAFGAPLGKAVRAALDRTAPRQGPGTSTTGQPDHPVRVVPGSLGRWSDRTGGFTR
jgi:MinD-like ATPase involved in chromosome partitioning or flagellar assembly